MRKQSLFACLFLISYFLFPLPVYAGPSSVNFELKQYGFGAGGTENSTSTNFKALGTAGEVEIGLPGSASFKAGSGLAFTLNANVPPAPAFTNPATNYDRLKFVINTGGNTSDATYAIAISADNFVSDTRYIKSDKTIGVALTSSDYQSYASWGDVNGAFVTGLQSNTTYYIKTKSRKGNFTETGYGPVASATTSDPSLTFGMNTSSITFSNLNSGNAYTDSSKSTVLTTSTNAYSGYIIYAKETQSLTSSGSKTIGDYGALNSTPTTWTGTGFGYTTSDSNLPTGGIFDRFTSGGPKYAGFWPSIQDPVADHTSVIQDPTLTNESFTISYQVTAPDTIEAGNYTNTIIYTIVPIY